MTKVEQEQLGALDGRYTARDMAVLEGLEPVRKRPGMFIGSTGPSGLHHLVWEVVDNSVDEAMAGFCDRIDVTLLADGGCRVVDNGRGIPIDINPQYKLSGVEIALDEVARRGQVRRSGLQGLRRSPRRRRLGGKCAVAKAHRRSRPQWGSGTGWSSSTAANPLGNWKSSVLPRATGAARRSRSGRIHRSSRRSASGPRPSSSVSRCTPS